MPRRSRKTQDLATWLGTSQTPLFVLDAERRIRVFNAGLQSLTGWSAADVVGEVCRYAPEAPGQTGAALAASLCPPRKSSKGRSGLSPPRS
ncbi:MAG: PAS domain-containing protein [Planctomycetaceae bacterium]